jgi:hypothetical protein
MVIERSLVDLLSDLRHCVTHNAFVVGGQPMFFPKVRFIIKWTFLKVSHALTSDYVAPLQCNDEVKV